MNTLGFFTSSASKARPTSTSFAFKIAKFFFQLYITNSLQPVETPSLPPPLEWLQQHRLVQAHRDKQSPSPVRVACCGRSRTFKSEMVFIDIWYVIMISEMEKVIQIHFWPNKISTKKCLRMTPNDPKWPKNDLHFFRNFFLTEKPVPQTLSLLECMC